MQTQQECVIEPLLDERQVAKILGISVWCLQQWRVRREGPPHHKIGRSVRYRVSEIEAWIDATRVDSAGGR